MICALPQLQFSAKFKCFSTPVEFRKSRKCKNDSILCFCMFARLILDVLLYREPDARLSNVFACLGAQKWVSQRKYEIIFSVRAVAVPMANHSHWHIHCRSRADSHSHGHRQSYGGRALGLSHSDCHRRCHGNGVATANDNGRGNGHAIAVAMAKARGLAMILMTIYAISVIFLLRQRQFSAIFKFF